MIDLTDSPPILDRKRKRSEVNSVTKKPSIWVTSSFDDFSSKDQPTKSTKGSKVNWSRKNSAQDLNGHSSSGSSSKKNVSRNLNGHGSSDQVSAVTNYFKVGNTAYKNKKKNVIETELWADKHAPNNQADLAVHKKKIAEVEQWLQGHLGTNRRLPPILLLTGPSGAGKTATIQALSHDLKYTVQEWINPITSTYNQGLTDGDDKKFHNYVPSESQMSLFQQFLLRANKYSSLGIFGEDQPSRKVILVEEFPNVFYRDASIFHEIVRKYRKVGKCPLVFIISDSTKSDSNERLLFPKHLQQELEVENISFNAVAPTSMVKVLTKIATKESSQGGHKFTMPSKTVIESISMSSAGDIRGAINALQFACEKDTTDLVATGRMKGKSSLKKQSSSKTTKSKLKSTETAPPENESELAAIGGRDTSLFLFRALGKILYCKRDNPSNYTDLPRLPLHLTEHERDPLIINPEEVIEKSHLSGEYFTAYLHQNYLEFYTDIDDLVRSTEYLSDADFLTVEWASRSALQDYAASVATRGIIHSNSSRKRHDAGGIGFGWRPLHKPQWYTANKVARQNAETGRSLFRSTCHGCPPVVLQTEVLPYLSLINITLHNPGQITFLQDVCRFSKARLSIRSEKLDEKDVELDSEETENASQIIPALKHNQKSVSMETDDVISNSQSKIEPSKEEEQEEYEIEEFDD